MEKSSKNERFGDFSQYERARKDLYEVCEKILAFPREREHERYFLLAVIRRTLSLETAFRQSVDACNGQMAMTLVRLNLDTLARFYALYWADETDGMTAETFAKEVAQGKRAAAKTECNTRPFRYGAAPMSYHELSIPERATLQLGLAQGFSQRRIARMIDRSPSTISRELRRNRAPGTSYQACTAQQQMSARRQACRPERKLLPGSERFELVVHMLRERLSPEQIAGKLRSMNIPSLRDAYVCRETIYNAIYALPVGGLRKELIICLRQGKTSRRPRSGGVDRRGQIPEMLSIHVRPPEIEDRLMPGHWEGDLIKGKANASAVGTLVERTSGYLILIKMADATATSALEGFSAALNRMPLAVRKSMTYDQGREMTRHAELTQQTGVAIYFCDPHSPWQRGSNENINGLIRQYLPKGTDLSVHSQEALDAIALQLNMRPRKRFDFKCPIEVMGEVMQEAMAMRHDAPASIQ